MAERNKGTAPHHCLELGQLLADLQSDEAGGLGEAEAQRRLDEHGLNRTSARRGSSALRKFSEQFVQPLVIVLIAAAIISGLLGHQADALVILAVVVVNAVIGFLQEYRAEQAIAALDSLVETEATVLRDGHHRRIPSTHLVVGDVVLIASGDSVPADLRLIASRELRVEEAALTGESVSVAKHTATLPEDTVLGDRVNMAFAGTLVTYGRARGLVVATGDATETGRIAGLLAETQELVTPLTRRIAAFSKLLVWLILAVAGALFAFETLRGSSLTATFNAAIALAVGAIPEGLPAAVTVLLAVGVQSLARRGALVRKLPAVETLGSTTVICSDKTGTLTENAMTVTRFVTGGDQFEVSGSGYRAEGDFSRDGIALEPKEHAALSASLRISALCNDAKIIPTEDQVRIEGDPTEAALRVAAEKAALLSTFDALERVDEIPFESQHMYMATLHQQGDESLILVKGSSDVLIKRCRDALDARGNSTAFNSASAQEEVKTLAAKGLRVLCLAQRVVPRPVDQLEHADISDLTFVGLVAMQDPPRETAKDAVAACHRAGIKVKMITGDHAVTASAIAEQLGLRGELDQSGHLRAVTGAELDLIDADQLPRIAEDTAVFARVAPEQKLRIVQALQGRGHVVAMTGDGVNDAPALKQADLGIAMGKQGTDVARGASAMILTDDNFETIAAAVEEGRGVYDNLVKFITWTLPTNGGEALILLAALVAGTALPVLPVQILWVNMATALLLGVTLVFEPKEPGLMERSPRPVDARLLDWRLGTRTLAVSVLVASAAFGLFSWSLTEFGMAIDEARTITVNTIVVVESAYLFACRSLRHPIWRIGFFSNLWVWLGAGVMMLAQMIFTYLPGMNRLFHSSPIDWIWWVYFTVAGLIVFVAVESAKVVLPTRRNNHAWQETPR